MQILAIKKILEIWNLEGYFKIKNGEKLKVKKNERKNMWLKVEWWGRGQNLILLSKVFKLVSSIELAQNSPITHDH